MIDEKRIKEILENYNQEDLTIAVLGGHSALDVCRGAKRRGFRTLVVAQKGREKTYSKYYRRRSGKGIVDEVIVLDRFADVVNEEVQEKLRELNALFVHNRYFWVYCDFNKIENEFAVPIIGSRSMLKLEERDLPYNQYHLLQEAEIRIPKIFEDPRKIDRLCIVKANEALRGYERAFFYVHDYESYQTKSKEMMEKGIITEKALQEAVIEEFVLGAQVNFNYFYSPISDELEFMGTDTRRQTNLDGILRLPAEQQLQIKGMIRPKIIETGHYTVTIKESIIEKAMAMGEKFVAATKKLDGRGIIGPFGLQGAVVPEEGKEDIVIFDASLRIPGSPGTQFTPYTGYLYLESISYGDRIAMEVEDAVRTDKLDLICT
ncbi:MAG: DUF1297 domain-containing protein [Methanobacteriota archaeon]|nr:MAG: DUF1297 domain-containing protein [Euryarchaeota archaeon]